MTNPLLVNRTQAAKRLGVGVKVFDAMRAAGAIKGVKVPGMARLMFSLRELEQVIEQHQLQ